MRAMFSRKGTLPRLPYTLVAVPILLAFANGGFIVNNLPILLSKLGVTLTLVNIGAWMSPILLGVQLLIIPLLFVTIMRLRDVGASWRLAGLLALPYLINQAVRTYAGWARVVHELGQPLPSQSLQQIITYISAGTFIYGLGLALMLCVLPSRKIAPDMSEAAA